MAIEAALRLQLWLVGNLRQLKNVDVWLNVGTITVF